MLPRYDEAGAAEGVDRVVFLALRGEEGHVECFRPVPVDEKPELAHATGAGQMQLLGEDGSATLLNSVRRKRHGEDKAPV